MKPTNLPAKTEAAIWLQILHPDGELPPATARALLGLSLPEHAKELLKSLSAKARMGTLTPDEDALMDRYEKAGAMLATLKSKARQKLKKVSAAS
jgi:hypothetical protein